MKNEKKQTNKQTNKQTKRKINEKIRRIEKKRVNDKTVIYTSVWFR